MRIIFILAALGYSFSAAANFQTDFMKAKAAQRATSRWTLNDWLQQKSKMRLADQWLALHSSSPFFEFIPSAGYQTFKTKTTDADGESMINGSAQVYRLDLYASILALRGEFAKTNAGVESHGGALGLRILGTSAQSTSLVLSYGWQKRSDFIANEYRENRYLEAQLQLYLLSFFGLQGDYRHYFSEPDHKAAAGAFVDFGALRIFTEYFEESVDKENSGLEYGLKLFF